MSANKPLPAPSGQIRLLLMAAGAGLVGGSVAVLFRALAGILPSLVWPSDPNLVRAVAMSPWWLRLVVPVGGALLAGTVLIFGGRWLGAVRGWDILEAVVLRDGILHLRSAIVRGISSLVTVATAGPVGREGSMVLLSAAAGSTFARGLRVPVRHRRLLVACGVAAGIACAYNAPIGAALFTMEIIVGNFALEVFGPLVFASVTATLLARAAFNQAPLFQFAPFDLVSVWEVLPYTLLGALGGLVAAVFLRSLRGAATFWRRTGLPRPAAMACGALILGVVILWLPDVVGNGREAIVLLFEENWTPGFALLLLGARILVTSTTVGSGAVGGVFTPTLFLGAMLGDAFGSAVHWLLPTLTAGSKAYALVGMGAVLAGTTHAPITAILLLFEMTLDYNIVLPLLVACAAASLVARSLDEQSVYTEALRRKRGTPAPTGEAAVMSKLTVSDVMRGEHITVPSDTPLPQLLDRFIVERRNHMYVVDAEGVFAGSISLYEASRALREAPNPQEIRAGDVANADFQTTIPSEHLDRTLDRFWASESERLPVLDRRDRGRVIGTVSKRDILGVYSLEVLHRRSLLARFEEDHPEAKPTYVELPEDHQIDSLPVPADLVGKTFAESRLREAYGISVLVVRRIDPSGKVLRIIPEGKTRLEEGDRLIVFGARDKLAAFQGATNRVTG